MKKKKKELSGAVFISVHLNLNLTWYGAHLVNNRVYIIVQMCSISYQIRIQVDQNNDRILEFFLFFYFCIKKLQNKEWKQLTWQS